MGGLAGQTSNGTSIMQAALTGIGWAGTSPLDAAYRNPGGMNTNANVYANGVVPTSYLSPTAQGYGFNLAQWFKDQGVTQAGAQTLANYDYDRGLSSSNAYMQSVGSDVGGPSAAYGSTNSSTYGNPYGYTGNAQSGVDIASAGFGNSMDTFNMNAQNNAGLHLASNSAPLTTQDITILANQSAVPRINAVGASTATNSAASLQTPLNLGSNTLLGGGQNTPGANV
jgi:hypothetical protein